VSLVTSDPIILSSTHINIDYSIYEEKKVKVNTEIVISQGEIIIKNNKFTGKAGRGNYIKRGLSEII
jgi:dihydropyrimidinase